MYKGIKLDGFSFSVTSYCGCKCKHCMLDSGISKKNFLDKNIILDVCKQIKELDILTDEPIALTGGELSFHTQIKEIIKEISKLGFKKINLSLTGMGFSEEDIKEIAAFINIASFSIDGDREYHNLFRGVNIYDKSIQSMLYFQRYGAKNTAIQMSICKNNIKYIDDIINLARVNNVQHVRLVPVLPIGRAINNIDKENFLDDSDYEYLLNKIVILNGMYSDMYISSMLDRKSFLLKKPEYVYGVESIKDIEINEVGEVFFNGIINDRFCIGNIFEKNIKEIIDNFLMGDKFKEYNTLSKKIYNDHVVNGKKKTLCIYEYKVCDSANFKKK